MRVFVQDVQESYLPAITGFVFNKIITPYMILVLDLLPEKVVHLKREKMIN